MNTPHASPNALVLRVLARVAPWLFPAPARSTREELLQHFPFAPVDPRDCGATSQK